jgi:protein SCO1/2
MRRRIDACLAATLLLVVASPAPARTIQEAYRDVGVTLPPGAALPSAGVVDARGVRRNLHDMISRPTVLVFADYTCKTLCGPIVAFVGAALEQSGLPPDQYRLLVVGLDPRDGAAEAARMRQDHLGAAIESASAFVTANAATVTTIASSLGYRYAYDAQHDQFIHPAAAYVLRADGRVTRVFSGIGLSGSDMRLALVEAGEGRIGTLRDQVRLICSSFDPAQGAYNVMVSRVLVATGLATLAALAGGVGLLVLMGGRRPV